MPAASFCISLPEDSLWLHEGTLCPRRSPQPTIYGTWYINTQLLSSQEARCVLGWIPEGPRGSSPRHPDCNLPPNKPFTSRLPFSLPSCIIPSFLNNFFSIIFSVLSGISTHQIANLLSLSSLFLLSSHSVPCFPLSRDPSSETF